MHVYIYIHIYIYIVYTYVFLMIWKLVSIGNRTVDYWYYSLQPRHDFGSFSAASISLGIKLRKMWSHHLEERGIFFHWNISPSFILFRLVSAGHSWWHLVHSMAASGSDSGRPTGFTNSFRPTKLFTVQEVEKRQDPTLPRWIWVLNEVWMIDNDLQQSQTIFLKIV